MKIPLAKFVPLLSFFVVISNFTCISQTVLSETSLRYPGSEKKLQDCVLNSDVVFIGQVIGKGPVILSSPGVSYRSYTVEVSTALKGTVAGQVTVSLDVKNDGKVIEVIPHFGENYIFIAALKEGDLIAMKLLPRTSDEIAQVKALLANAPVSK
jgi:hypothetical protein